jgi:hypothetical protein
MVKVLVVQVVQVVLVLKAEPAAQEEVVEETVIVTVDWLLVVMEAAMAVAQVVLVMVTLLELQL